MGLLQTQANGGEKSSTTVWLVVARLTQTHTHTHMYLFKNPKRSDGLSCVARRCLVSLRDLNISNISTAKNKTKGKENIDFFFSFFARGTVSLKKHSQRRPRGSFVLARLSLKLKLPVWQPPRSHRGSWKAGCGCACRGSASRFAGFWLGTPRTRTGRTWWEAHAQAPRCHACCPRTWTRAPLGREWRSRGGMKLRKKPHRAVKYHI